ncbi:MAG: hypothetical protein JWL76_611 [Thermoleophilia bacterium]|nr:hypothetical protein [Thermoleophilia bacterium]
MKKLFSALALILTSVFAYRYVVDRMRAQLMGAAHPAGALAAVKVPRTLRKRTAKRFEYMDATQAVSGTWVDEQQLVRSATRAGDGAQTPTSPSTSQRGSNN